MSKILKFSAICLAPVFLPSLFSTAFAEPLDDVGTGKPCPECSTINTSPEAADNTVMDDVGTGAPGPWWDLLNWDLLAGSPESED